MKDCLFRQQTLWLVLEVPYGTQSGKVLDGASDT